MVGRRCEFGVRLQEMTPTLAAASTATAGAAPTRYQSVPREFLDPPNAWNPTVGLFLAGYGLAALTIWGWFVGQWSLPVLLALGFLALHLEGTVIHDACHNAAHPNRIINAVIYTPDAFRSAVRTGDGFAMGVLASPVVPLRGRLDLIR